MANLTKPCSISSARDRQCLHDRQEEQGMDELALSLPFDNERNTVSRKVQK